MTCRVYAHRFVIWIYPCDCLVHIEKVSIFIFNGFLPLLVNCIPEVEIHCQSWFANAIARIASFFCCARSYVPWNQVSKCGISSFQVIISLLLRDVVCRTFVALCFWDPYPAVIPERLWHECQLRLEFIELRNACRMDLDKAGVCKKRSLPVSFPSCRCVWIDCKSREIIYCTITPCSKNHGMCSVSFNFSGNKVASYYSACPAVDHNKVKHLPAGEHFYISFFDLPVQRWITAEKALLSGLSLGVEGPWHLYASKRACVECPSIVAGKRNTKGSKMIDHLVAHLGRPVYIGFTCTVVTPFYHIIKEPESRITVVLVILCGIYSSLCSYRVSPARRILVTEILHAISKLAQSWSSSCPWKTCSDDNNLYFLFVCRVNKFNWSLVPGPLFSKRTIGYLWNEFSHVEWVNLSKKPECQWDKCKSCR